MKCADIDSILDQHRTTTLAVAERSNVDTHLAGCDRCTDQWSAYQAVAMEPTSGARPGLFADIVGVVGTARALSPPRRTTSSWIPVVGLAAVFVLAVVAWWSVASRRMEPSDAASTAAETARADKRIRSERFQQGVHYTLLAAPAPAVDDSAAIEIDEFFMYGCYHCYMFEGELERWRAALPTDTKLVRVPAVFNPLARLHARAFYTAAALGKGELHEALYDEIHRKGDPLASEAALEALFARFGVDGATFRATFESPDVEARVLRAEALSREYRISATPSLVIDHKFFTSPSLAGSAETMLAVAADLLAKERERRRASDAGQ